MSQSGTYGIGGSGSSFVQTLTGNSGGPVGPTGGNIDILGTNVLTVIGNPGASSLSIELSNGTDGQLLIGGGAMPIWASLTSTDGSVVFTPGANSLSLEVAGSFSNTFNGDTGSATPALGIIAFTGGTNGGFFTAAGSTLTLSFNYLKLPDTDALGNGIIYFNNVPYFHNFGSSVPGADNLFIGANAGNTAFTPNFADWNLGIGTDVLSSIINGALANTAVGYQSMISLTNGTHNTAVGYFSQKAMIDGSDNTSIGYNTMINLQSGNSNIAVGNASGNNLTTNESDNILIGNGGVTGNSSEIHIGTSPTQTKCFIAGIASVITSNSEFVTIDTTTGQLGSVSSTGAINQLNGDSGSATGSTVTIFTNPASNGGTAVFTGSAAQLELTITDADNNTALGNNSLVSGGGSLNNTAFGINCLGNAITNGDHNVAIGSTALSNSTTGATNTACGFGALSGVNTGSNNIALGYNAASAYTTTESNNIIIGNVGTITDSARIRIGTNAVQTSAFIVGIDGVNVGSTAKVVTMGTAGTADQLGTATITAGTGITVTPGANTITIASSGTTSLTYTNVNTTPYVVLTTDEYLSVDSSGGGITVQLPNAATLGRVFIIKDRTGSANTNNITVTTVGGAVNIDGATTYVMNTQYAAIQVIGNGSTYEIF